MSTSGENSASGPWSKGFVANHHGISKKMWVADTTCTGRPVARVDGLATTLVPFKEKGKRKESER